MIAKLTDEQLRELFNRLVELQNTAEMLMLLNDSGESFWNELDWFIKDVGNELDRRMVK